MVECVLCGADIIGLPFGPEGHPKCYICEHSRWPVRRVEICSECGGKYRPAGGPCIHEHPSFAMVKSLRDELRKCQARIAELEAEADARDLQDLADAAFRDYVQEVE